MKLTLTENIANQLDKLLDKPHELSITAEFLKEMGCSKEVDNAMMTLAMTYKRMYEIAEHQTEMAEKALLKDFD